MASLLDWGSRSYGLTAGLLWPLLEGGRLKAALAQADARQTEALLAYRKTVLTALQEVEDALVRGQADAARAADLRTSLAAAQAAEALALDRYRAGISTYSPVLAAEQAVVEGQDQLVQAEDARARDVVALYRALGGGWDDKTEAAG